jgi:hypothetical protein
MKSHTILYHGSWVAGAIVLALAVYFTRIAYDAMYAQQQMMMYPRLTMFLQTTAGKAVAIGSFGVAAVCFFGTYRMHKMM